MKKIRAIIFLYGILCGAVLPAWAQDEPVRYARAEKFTPVLNTADFQSVFGGADGRTLKQDKSGLIREIEFIALPGTAFVIEESIQKPAGLIYRVRTAEYAAPEEGLYIDSRFVQTAKTPFSPRFQKRPAAEKILSRMLANQGAAYVWGGNAALGIPALLRYYPPRGKISAAQKDLWTLKGLDCSGLLYEAANGTTPRNTSGLIAFGRPVLIAGLTAGEIDRKLKPLDLLVWKGHVIIVLDEKRTIESCLSCSASGGVTVRKRSEVLPEIMKTRVPADEYGDGSQNSFVVRRWY